MITFSAKPMTLRDHVLVDRLVKSHDVAALLELIVRRSDPPVTEEVAGALESADIPQVISAISDSISASTKVDALVTAALRGI